MNKYKKGFAQIVFIAIGVIVLVTAVGVSVALVNRNAGLKTEIPMVSSGAGGETKDWKTYQDSHFSFNYPSDYNFTFNLCGSDCNSIAAKGSSDSHVWIHAEKK